MKKQQPQPSSPATEKLGLKSETLRRMIQPVDDEQLAEIAGGRAPISKSPTTAC